MATQAVPEHLNVLKLRAEVDPSGETRHYTQTDGLEVWTRRHTLGQGAYGFVWKEQCTLGPNIRQLRAVKIVRRRYAKSWRRELKAMAKFSEHVEHFVQVKGWFSDPEHLYIAMEFVEYGSLYENIVEQPKPLSDGEAVTVVTQVAQAVQFMHRVDFLHRDLKLQNILVARPGPQWHVKLADFGIAKDISSLGASSNEQGTLGYMAPEILSGLAKDRYSKAGDVWGIGVISFFLLTKVLPFRNGTFEVTEYGRGNVAFPSKPLDRRRCTGLSMKCIESALQPSPGDRLTVDQLLQDPWLAPDAESHSEVESEEGDVPWLPGSKNWANTWEPHSQHDSAIEDTKREEDGHVTTPMPPVVSPANEIPTDQPMHIGQPSAIEIPGSFTQDVVVEEAPAAGLAIMQAEIQVRSPTEEQSTPAKSDHGVAEESIRSRAKSQPTASLEPIASIVGAPAQSIAASKPAVAAISTNPFRNYVRPVAPISAQPVNNMRKEADSDPNTGRAPHVSIAETKLQGVARLRQMFDPSFANDARDTLSPGKDLLAFNQKRRLPSWEDWVESSGQRHSTTASPSPGRIEANANYNIAATKMSALDLSISKPSEDRYALHRRERLEDEQAKHNKDRIDHESQQISSGLEAVEESPPKLPRRPGTEAGLLVCPDCHRRLKDEEALHAHYRISHGKSFHRSNSETLFTCPDCPGRYFRNEAILESHFRDQRHGKWRRNAPRMRETEVFSRVDLDDLPPPGENPVKPDEGISGKSGSSVQKSWSMRFRRFVERGESSRSPTPQ